MRLDKVACIRLDNAGEVVRIYSPNLDANDAPVIEEYVFYSSSHRALKQWLSESKPVWDFEPKKVYSHKDGLESLMMDNYDNICLINNVSSYLLSRL